MKHFKFYSKEDILSLTKVRRFETRLGERILHIKNRQDLLTELQSSPAQYVIIGIPEDIGVKGNLGIGGADTNWLPFLNAFLNVQSNSYFSGENILLLGHFDFGDLKYLIENSAGNPDEQIDAYRHAVNHIDEEVEDLLKVITCANKIPVIIGGGHNNAYPIIKGVSKGLHKCGIVPLAQINCVNLDAHTDYKTTEGRHSGNAFRYAENDGYLGKYCVLGVHESYIPQNVIIDIDNNPFVRYITYEDIFLRNRLTFHQAVTHALEFTSDTITGIEIDMDALENVLSSAETPSGVPTLLARQFINQTGKYNIAYLHLCEGASQIATGKKDETTGKLVSYLVTDFIKSRLLNRT